MHAIVDSAIRLEEADLPPRALALLHRALSFPNPEYVLRERMRRWTGATPEEICLIDRAPDGRLVMPRGAVGALRHAVAAAGAELAFEDRRVRHPPLDLELAFTLRGYQADAAGALVRHTQGVAVLPCGAGKTILGAGAIHRTRQPTLVLAHTHDLVEQWRETLRAALGVEPGVLADGRHDIAPITVATIQTLANLAPDALAELGARFGAVILDECHHVPASTFRDVVGTLPAFYRFGLTATLERADGLTPLVTFALGAPVFEIDHACLVADGHLVVPEVIAVETGVTVDAETHTALVAALVEHEPRNALIVSLAVKSAAAGHATLVLSARVDHCQQLASRLQDDGVPAAALTGRTPKGRRGPLLDAFRAGELRVVCATSLADEGLDVSRLERLILATPARAEGRTIQRLGRLMRPHPGKRTPILYDLVDDHPTARRQHLARRRAYKKVLGDITPRRVPASEAP